MHSTTLEQYLATIGTRLTALPAAQRDEELREIRQHLEALIAGHLAMNRTQDEAVALAIAQFGRAEQIGRDLERAWERRESARAGRREWSQVAAVYVLSAIAIFVFLAITMDQPGDFAHERSTQVMLALVFPLGVLSLPVGDSLRRRLARGTAVHSHHTP